MARVHAVKADPSEEDGSHARAQSKGKGKGKGNGNGGGEKASSPPRASCLIVRITRYFYSLQKAKNSKTVTRSPGLVLLNTNGVVVVGMSTQARSAMQWLRTS